jgi:hypothetical protein
MTTTGPSPATPAERRAGRSRAALVRRFPDLAPVLALPTVVEAIANEDAVIDMGLNGGRFYGGDGRAVAARQVEDFLAAPVRFLRPTPLAVAPGAGALEHRMLSVLDAGCRRLGIDPATLGGEPALDSGPLIVLGIGLGHHLPLLAARTGTRHLIIAETEPEFLRQAAAAIDWGALFEQIEGRGGRISLFLASSAAVLAAAIGRTIEAHGLPMLDGSTLYQHYNNLVLTETGRRVAEATRVAFLPRRSYEVERLLLENATVNLARTRFRLLDPRPKPGRAEPVFLIGNGPSLDANIEHVRRLREGAMVFSCGAALGVCRRHGIVPDFHCENEEDRARPAGPDRRDLADTILVAEATVSPRLPSRFRETWLYFRAGSTASRLLASPELDLQQAGPLAANRGLRAAVAMGFRTVYLFGVDCGSRFAGRLHAHGASGEVFDDPGGVERSRYFDSLVPGNFGGTLATDDVLTESRLGLAALIARGGLQVINCSNGALIEGARPRHASDVSFAIPRLDRARIRREIAGVHPEYPPGALLAGRSFAPARQATARFFDEVTAELDTAAGCDEIFPFWQRMAPLLDEHRSGRGDVSTLASGSAQSLAALAACFLNRIPDPERRHLLFRDVLTEYRGSLLAIRDDTLAQLDALAARYLPPM